MTVDAIAALREPVRRDAYAVLWWIPADTLPTPEEAGARLTRLRTHGATAEAFTFRTVFPAPGTVPTGAIAAGR